MVWLKFTADFSWKPTMAATIDYPRGSYSNVPSACAAAALAAYAAIEERPPERQPSAAIRLRRKRPEV